MASANPSRLGGEAQSIGESQNESTPAEQRKPGSNAPKTNGPRKGKNGEFLPAQYPKRNGLVRIDR